MKIGIITFQRAYSYGAKLQAYALSTYLRLNGHQAEVIDYSDIGCGKPRGLDFSRPGVFLRSCVSLARSFHKERVRLEKLQSFFLDDTPHSKRYPTAESLKGIEADYDIFIAGSDQVWCPRYNRGDLNFLLEFVKESKKKYSYAASFGKENISKEMLNYIKKTLMGYRFISVREQSGVEIIKQCGIDSLCVVDPTLLLSAKEWNKYEKEYDLKEDYILVYTMEKNISIVNIANYVSNKMGLKIVHFRKEKNFDCELKKAVNAGPGEFLTLFKNAK